MPEYPIRAIREIILNALVHRGYSVPTIREEMRNAGLPEPVFRDEKGIFTVILYNSSHEKKDIVMTAGQNRLLEFRKTPRSRAEIAEYCGKTQYYVMKKFVEPLIQQGLLEYTIPDRPKSPSQRFRTVE